MAYHYLWLEVPMLIHWIVSWLLAALALWIVAYIIPGIKVRDFRAALIAALEFALVDIITGPILRSITFPLTLLTLELFWLVVNAIRLNLALIFTPAFA